MNDPLTLPAILANALNADYTADSAVEDLTRRMNRATLAEMEHGTHSPQHVEILRLIPVQERLARAKSDKNK